MVRVRMFEDRQGTAAPHQWSEDGDKMVTGTAAPHQWSEDGFCWVTKIVNFELQLPRIYATTVYIRTIFWVAITADLCNYCVYPHNISNPSERLCSDSEGNKTMFWKEGKRVRKGEQAMDEMVKDENGQYSGTVLKCWGGGQSIFCRYCMRKMSGKRI